MLEKLIDDAPSTTRECHDAIPEREQRAVDMGALEATRPQPGALRTRQVDEEQPAALHAARYLTAHRHAEAVNEIHFHDTTINKIGRYLLYL